ncbi:MAG TPA: DUF2169 domain-containing protein, partial [Polyangium sp.]|nr:DUF2169 domain-containing protein [Polyangium sp.]
FHTAPRDQRIDLLRTGVPLVLNNVLPNQARVETTLPTRKPQAFRIHPQTGKASEIILRCDTLCVDAARNLFVLTFRGIADMATADLGNMGTIVVAAHSTGKKIRGDRIERFLRNGEPIEGDTHDARHPLEKRYDTVLAAPKGDTMALPEMEGGSEVWPAQPMQQNDSGLFRAGVGLPFQSAPMDAPPPLVPPAPLHAPGGGRRLATIATPMERDRAADMPFHTPLNPPAPPPDGVFPPPPAFLPIAPALELPPLIRQPAMLGTSFSQDEKTADLPPGHAQPLAEVEDATVDLVPKAAAAMRLEMPASPPVVEPSEPATPAPGLAGKSIDPPKPAIVAPAAPKPALIAPKPATVIKPADAPTPKPTAPAAPKPITPSTAAKPSAVAPAAPKPVAPKGPIKVPAPLGPKLKAEGAAKPAVLAPGAEKKTTTVAPDKPARVAVEKPASTTADKPVAPTKPAPVPLRPLTATMPFPSMVKPGTAAGVVAQSAPVVTATPVVAENVAVATPKPPVVAENVPAATKKPPVVDKSVSEVAKDAPNSSEASVDAQEPFEAAKALKLEECAALDAELRHRPTQRKTLLEKNKLTEEQWQATQKHWTESITRETEVGERKLLLAYDGAYVATQERLGINVGIDTHAKLQVATERGTSATALKELGLEPTDQMRLGRVWTQKLADEPTRMRELAAAIEKARAG